MIQIFFYESTGDFSPIKAHVKVRNFSEIQEMILYRDMLSDPVNKQKCQKRDLAKKVVMMIPKN